MKFLVNIWNTILYQPLLNFLILLYIALPGHDFGMAVIILTVIVRLILLPSSLKSVKSQRILNRLQPKIKEIQKKYKNDREAQSRALFELYRKEKITPFSGCLPLLLQLPILIALYQVFLKGLKPETLARSLYSFVPFQGEIHPTFLGIINLAQPFISKIGGKTQYYLPAFILALLAGVLQFLQMKLTTPEQKNIKKEDFSHKIQSQMSFIFPFLAVYIVLQFGSIIGLYWITSSLFSIGEVYFVKRFENKNI